MRQILLAAVLVAGIPVAAAAQTWSRLEVGPVTRLDRVFIEGGASGGTLSAGVSASVWPWRSVGVEFEVTQASRDISRSYEGSFVSYTTVPNPTHEEFERMAPTARRTLGYAPGLGWAGAVVFRDDPAKRVAVAVRLGVSGRRYGQTSSYVVLTIPEGVDPARVARDFADESRSRTRGGLLAGVSADVDITKNMSLIPEARFVYGGPAQVGNKHRELGLGLRAFWRF